MSSDLRRRNVAYARYQRAICVLVLTPLTVNKEVSDPSGAHLALIAATVGLTLLAGWMYRTAVDWWVNG